MEASLFPDRDRYQRCFGRPPNPPVGVPPPLEDDGPLEVALTDGPLGPPVVVVPAAPVGPPPTLMPAAEAPPLVAVIVPELTTPPLAVGRLRLMPTAGPEGLLALIAPEFVTPLMLEEPVAPIPTPEAPELMTPWF